MADGDIVHKGLPKRFLNFYGQLCEGHWEASELGYKALNPLKRQLKHYGNVPTQLGGKIAMVLEKSSIKLLAGESINWAEVRIQINSVDKDMMQSCPPRARDMVLEAGHQVLLKIQYGQHFKDIKTEVIKAYCDAVYKNDFEDRVQETPQHYKATPHSEVERRKEEIRPYVEYGRIEFAKQLVRGVDVSKLRRSRLLKASPPALEESAW
jgi:hypothetical protein